MDTKAIREALATEAAKHPCGCEFSAAPTWLQQLLDKNTRLTADMEAAEISIKAWKNLESEFETLKGNYRQLLERNEELAAYVRASKAMNEHVKRIEQENRKLQSDKAIAASALRKAEKFIGAIMGFYGQNLSVFNWHLNGEGEPWDNFFDENMDGDELEVIRAALEQIEGGKKK